jgi:hypothetical protein
MKDFLEFHKIATVFLGTIGGTIAILGVILPITSGDTPLEQRE